MGSPPTVTLGSAGAASTIANATLRAPATAPFQYLGTIPTYAGGSFPDNALYVAATVTDPPTSKAPWQIEFDFDGDAFDVYLKAFASSGYRIWVDGVPATAGFQATGGSAGSLYHLLVDFGSAEFRRIRLDVSATFYFGGVYAHPNYSVIPPSTPKGPRMVFLGDSYTEPTINSATVGTNSDGYATQAGRLLGYNDVWASGAGGTGYLNPGGSGRVKFRDRLSTDVLAYSPDVVVVAGGRNDTALNNATVYPGGAGTALTAFATEAAALFSAIRTGLPSAKVFAIGPWASSTANNTATADGGNFVGIGAAIETAVEAINGVYIDNLGGAWLTGSGRVGATAGDGNADIYVGTDGAHPVQAGHDYLARRVAAAIAPHLPFSEDFDGTA